MHRANQHIDETLRLRREHARSFATRWLPTLLLSLAVTVGLATASTTGGLFAPENLAFAQSGKKKGRKGKTRRVRKKDKKVDEPSSDTPADAANGASQPAATPGTPGPAPAEVKADGGEGAGAGAPEAGAPDAAGDGGTAAKEPAPSDTGDIDGLRQEYLSLRDELFRSRARAATVASAMYSTRLQINLTYSSGRMYSVTRTVIRLDGASVFDDATGVIATDNATRFEGFVAPGRHLIAVRIEATGKDDERFTTAVENTFTIQAPAGKDVTVTVKARDDGDMAYAWQKKERGSYQPNLSISVTTSKRADAPAKKGARTQPAKAPALRTAEAGHAK